jgi:hypothetical protein
LLTRAKVSIAALAIACLLSMTIPLRTASAAQSASPIAIRQEVPDNPAPHTTPEQPLPYSHKAHLALGLQCAGCHTNPAPGKLMTYPATATCMSCHHAIAKNKPTIKKLAAYAKSGQPVPWLRVYQVLPGVNWTHRKHLDAGIKCETCHGQVAEMATMSEATSVTTMGVCLHCHTLHDAATVCATCHLWP